MSTTQPTRHQPLAKKHDGMKVDSSVIYRDIRGGKFMREQMHKHLTEMASRYYAGDIAAVDEFCQLYCLGEAERKKVCKNEEKP